ncbi:hypothetical protein KP509_23G019500 [Ceratopteris richardii]|uniref:EXPERA domain-containing protein n=1 Tax=Ceratopteris richardii TaxID=49495 RepID=A0A8T2RXS5_CERRI|nr:hypothetical protein KP509_23G019500 [Ceratopteris richardii]
MASVKRFADLFFTTYFVMHIFITVFVDSQAILPASLYPLPLRSIFSWHISFSGDYLMRDMPPYFKGLVFAEVFLQIPLFFANAYGFYHEKRWARTTGLIYGVTAATSLVPILTDFLYSNVATKNLLMAIYVPFLVIPLALVFHVIISYSETQPRNLKGRKRA